MSLFDLTGKTILVTGASSGIGRGVAVECSKMGATLLVVGRSSEGLNETLRLMPEGQHQAYVCDLCDFSAMAAMVSSLPKLDGIVHCAGVGQRILCRQLTEKDIDHVLNINLKAPMLLQSALLSEKKINKGASIVFMASIASWSPSVGNAVYSASKGGLVSYAKCLSLELAPRKIRVNCISPAMVWTDFVTRDGIDEELLREDEKNYPLKRYGTPADVACLAIYLLSDAAEWMTSSNVKLSGGVN